ncbi:hypothetical protein niasHT_033385 [Heterodera trifolii]|uniref:Uncharacterized protein n=1 Tax=Heterodera trifolii TaxID=157864 RepID=A0ABD2HU26_9BILA
MTPYSEFLFDLDPHRFNGFLIVITNKMHITGESCHLFGNLFSLELNGHWTGIACSHYMVRYEPAPLHVRMVSPVFTNLFVRQLITMMLTVVRFSCPSGHEYLRQCPNHPLCIPSHLFCDSMDNCGMGSDELWCPIPTDQTDHAANNIEQQNYTTDENQNLQIFHTITSSPILWAMVLLALAAVHLLVITVVIVIRRRKQRLECQQNTPTIRSMFINAMSFGAAGRQIPNMGLKRRSTHEGETIALLTLGLKNVLQTLPDTVHHDDDDHWHGTDYGTMEMGEDDGRGQHQEEPNQYGNGYASGHPCQHLTVNRHEEKNEVSKRVHWH